MVVPTPGLTTLQDAAGVDGNGNVLLISDYAAVVLQITGTFSANVIFEATLDGTNYVAVEGLSLNDGTKANAVGGTGLFIVPVSGMVQFRARVSAWASGSVTVVGRAFRDAWGLPDTYAAAGTVNIGDVDVASIAAGDTNIGNVDVASYPTYGTVKSGELAGSVTAAVMPTITCSMVKFKALGSNAGDVYIGASGATVADGTTDTTTGLELQPGDETGWLLVANLNVFYRICDNAGDDLTYLALA